VAAVAAVDTRIVDYADARALGEAASGCAAAVHLVGIIKETRDQSYASAHESTCTALAAAAARAGLSRIVYLSILGSRPDSPNACLASKGRAEEILLAGRVPACVLRVPMVLGARDFASHSLRRQATARVLFLPGGGRTLQQPIDARDVVRGVCAALERSEPIRGALDLGGPESLPHRELVARAAALYGRRPVGVPVPLVLVRTAVALLERLAQSPPMTTAMLEVLQHDDRVDPAPACKQLDLELTPLDETLRATVGPERSAG
jgi:NADH dehydrogenase